MTNTIAELLTTKIPEYFALYFLRFAINRMYHNKYWNY